MKRITKAVLGGVAGCGLILGATQAASGGPPHITYTYSGPLTDIQPLTSGPLDDEASATFRILESPDEGTGFRIRVDGFRLSKDVRQFAAHLHVGECKLPDELNPNPTGGHYNVDGPTGEVTAEKEVWFQLVPDDEGVAGDETWASFVPVDADGKMSVVIHALEPNQSGVYPKEACLPVLVEGWKPTAGG